jgi:hypothetical protein
MGDNSDHGEIFSISQRSDGNGIWSQKTEKMLLVMDIYATHRNKELLFKTAQTYYIDLLFIPPGMTATLQSLDATIFGALKSFGEDAWIKQYIVDPYQKFDRKKHLAKLKNVGNKSQENRFSQLGKRFLSKARTILKIRRSLLIEKQQIPSNRNY